jgi:hypothetical protein
VRVFSPAPGGGSSAALSFNIEPFQSGAPLISSLSPANAAAGGPEFTLTVNGTNFAAGDVVTWNGSVRATTFLTSTQVTATITKNDIATPGLGSVSVITSNPLLASPSVAFAVTGPNNPAPTISSLSPSSVAAGSADLEVLVKGSRFVANSFVEWNGVPLATAYLSGSQIMAMIPAADIAAATTANITVTNPAPGGGTSGSLTFTVN